LREIVRTNDPVLVSAIEALFNAAGIPHVVLDRNMSVLEGSIGILPRRIQVDEAHVARARQLLEEAAEVLTEIARSPQTWLWEGLLGQLYYGLSVAYARLNDEDVALDFLRRAVGGGWRDVHWLASDTELRGLRSLARFQTLQENLMLLPVVEFTPSAASGAWSTAFVEKSE